MQNNVEIRPTLYFSTGSQQEVSFIPFHADVALCEGAEGEQVEGKPFQVVIKSQPSLFLVPLNVSSVESAM